MLKEPFYNQPSSVTYLKDVNGHHTFRLHRVEKPSGTLSKRHIVVDDDPDTESVFTKAYYYVMGRPT
jgi:hypothetical protein